MSQLLTSSYISIPFPPLHYACQRLPPHSTNHLREHPRGRSCIVSPTLLHDDLRMLLRLNSVVLGYDASLPGLHHMHYARCQKSLRHLCECYLCCRASLASATPTADELQHSSHSTSMKKVPKQVQRRSDVLLRRVASARRQPRLLAVRHSLEPKCVQIVHPVHHGSRARTHMHTINTHSQ